eukprot:COSAG05_NODE_191_length_14617_cov_90.240736_21_plen_117_part_00
MDDGADHGGALHFLLESPMLPLHANCVIVNFALWDASVVLETVCVGGVETAVGKRVFGAVECVHTGRVRTAVSTHLSLVVVLLLLLLLLLAVVVVVAVYYCYFFFVFAWCLNCFYT